MSFDAGGPLNFNCRHPAFLIVVQQLWKRCQDKS
jgi:hypothetical protein